MSLGSEGVVGQSTPPPSPITLVAAGQPLNLLQFQAHRYATLQNGPARDPADARRAKPPLVVAGRAQPPIWKWVSGGPNLAPPLGFFASLLPRAPRAGATSRFCSHGRPQTFGFRRRAIYERLLQDTDRNPHARARAYMHTPLLNTHSLHVFTFSDASLVSISTPEVTFFCVRRRWRTDPMPTLAFLGSHDIYKLAHEYPH